MEQIIIGLVGLILAVLLYQERARRADNKALRDDIATARQESKTDNAALRHELKTDIATARDEAKADNAALRQEMATLREELKTDIATARQESKADNAALRQEMKADIAASGEVLKEMITFRSEYTDRRIDQLTDAVIGLTDAVGQLRGRTEALTAIR